MGRTVLNANQIIRPSCHLPNNMLPFLSSIFCLLFLLFSLPASSAYRPIIDGTRKHLDHNPYKPPTGCKTRMPEPNPRRLTVYHSRGPCSPTRHNLPAMDAVEMTDGTHEDVNLGSKLGIDNYVVTIGLGTPRRDMTVVMDTGSSITWVQCLPCDNCHHQKDDIFKPDMSSTYQTVHCYSSQCPSTTGCSANDDYSCPYNATYMDGSYSSGQYASDLLTLNAGNTIGNFLFGCGQEQNFPKLFGQTSGLLGLGPSSPSLLNQAAGTSIGQNFAYCLPQADSTGYLELGAGADDASAFATLISKGDSYSVELVGVGVNGVDLLSVTSTTMVVDTGTVLSQLPTELYSELKKSVEAAAVEALVQEDYSSDGCYEIQVANGTKELLPINVTLKLDGGAELVLDNASVFYPKGSSTWCLAFEEKKDGEDDSVLGNMLQRTYRWSYDLPNNRIGITTNAC